MAKLFDFAAREWRVQEQAREIRALREEIEKLRHQNERIRKAMRRCTTCDYRLEVLGRSPKSEPQP